MPSASELWVDPAPEVPEEGMATLQILEVFLTPQGQNLLASELREAPDLQAMQAVERAWLSTAVARADPAYHRGRRWARTKASRQGMPLSALRLKLGL